MSLLTTAGDAVCYLVEKILHSSGTSLYESLGNLGSWLTICNKYPDAWRILCL